MTRNIALYVRDILANMEHAEGFVEGMSYDEFRQDLKTSYAVVRCLEIIGKASKNVPAAIRRNHPAIPWKEMAGMRDKVIHLYFGVDPKKVWLAVMDDIPQLKPLMERVLKDLEGQ